MRINLKGVVKVLRKIADAIIKARQAGLLSKNPGPGEIK